MDLGLGDRVYVVTGGSRGLGFAAAQALVAEGARVVLGAPHRATAAAAAARLAHNAAAADTATWVAADNADPATPDRLLAAAMERFGRLDGALISVGGTPTGTIATTADQAWRSAFESVFLGAVRLARVLAAHLSGESQGGTVTGRSTGTGGSIVLVLASSVRVPLTELAISNGLFPGLAGVVKTLAGELGPAGIRINIDDQKVGEGRVDATAPVVFSADETTDVGKETGSVVTPDYGVTTNAFTGEINWIQLDLGRDDHDHLISPDERYRVAMARQ
jgi:3-oxoacyl-[acyl-carrier protein] reductase